MRVKGPNGLVFRVSDELGRALLADGDHQRVEDKPKAARSRRSEHGGDQMTAFATVADLEALLKTTYVGDDIAQVQSLLDAASGHLRFVIGQDVYPVTTSTYTAYPTFGREDLPQWPVVAVTSVKRDGMDVPFTYRPGFIMVGSDDPVDVTFTWGVASPPEELKRLTLVLAAQALQMFETTGALSAGGLSSLSIDDFRAAFADGGSETGISLSPHAEKSIRRAFGRGDVTVVEAYT